MSPAGRSTAASVREALATLRRLGTARNRHGLARYGIVATRAFGVSVADVRRLARAFGRDHALAQALWATGWYEARLLAAFVDEPERVTPVQMDRWCRDFENWADCDTACFHLFDRTPHAFGRVRAWARRRRELEKRAAFALLASLAQHDRATPDPPFAHALPLAERAASDGRNFVKKAVSWALRGIGERSPALNAAALAVARRLASSEDRAERWVGRDVVRQLERPLVRQRLARRAARRAKGGGGR